MNKEGKATKFGREASNAERRALAKAAKAAKEAGYTINRLWTLFLEEKKNNRSLRDDRYRYARYLAHDFGPKTVSELSVPDFDRLRARLENEGKAPQTVKHTLGMIPRVLNFALKKGYVDNVPTRALRPEMPKIDNQVTENLTREQAKKLLEVLDEDPDQSMAALVRLALYTGMRRSALLNLQWADLDFERSFITLRGEVAKKRKTEVIPMNAEARAILQSQPRTDGLYVFPGKFPDKPRVGLSAFLKRLRAKAALPENFRPLHGLRHSFASWLASSGRVSMFELQKLLTHATPQMTQRYAHLHDEAVSGRASYGRPCPSMSNSCPCIGMWAGWWPGSRPRKVGGPASSPGWRRISATTCRK